MFASLRHCVICVISVICVFASFASLLFENTSDVDYILIFIGDGDVNDEENIVVDNPVVERLVEKWINEGGLIGGFNVNGSDPCRHDHRYIGEMTKPPAAWPSGLRHPDKTASPSNFLAMPRPSGTCDTE